MARTKLNQRSANRVDVPMGATGGHPPSKISIAVLALSILTAVWAAAMLTPFGRVAYYILFAYLEYFMGVITLVSLSITIMVGLVATDRLVLSIRQRVLLQSAHRTSGVIAVVSLVVHAWTKTAESIRVIDIFIPFLAPYNTMLIGFGTLSGWIMMLVMWSGLARAKFIGRGRPWMWRSIHAISYLMWPIALMHGLAAGRNAATWVVLSYVLCVLMVLVGLAVRLSVSLNRRKDFSSTATGAMKPVGSLVPTQASAVKSAVKRAPRRVEPQPERVEADDWVPAATPRTSAAPVSAQPGPISGRPVSGAPMRPPMAPPMGAPMSAPVSSMPVSSMPVSSMPVSSMPVSGMPVSGSPYDEPSRRRYADEDEGAPRRRRAAADDTEIAVPRRRRAEGDRYDEPTGPISRRALEDDRYAEAGPVAPRRRRADDGRYADEAPGRRYADDVDEPRTRRYADDAEPRSRRYADEVEEPRGRRYAEEAEPAPRRAAEEEYPVRRRPAPATPAYDEEPAPRRRRYTEPADDYDVPARRREPDVRTGGRWSDEAPPPLPRQGRSPRYAEDDEAAPRARRDRGADVDRADSGRHSRSEFVDLAAPADPWSDSTTYLDPDETPTLVDIASRRARRQAQPEIGRTAGRGARRGRGRPGENGSDDAQYWRQLRGEAQ